MLDNIKLILNLKDDTYDNLIELYIKKYTTLVLAYCNIETLNSALENIIEDKVIVKLKETILSSSDTSENNKISSISRGGYSVTFNVATAKTTDELMEIKLSQKDKNILNNFRKVRW
ncbi:phage head-tail connector protein [Clostridioides difficile]|uniref:phage head-tail connector protein n=1 Tax=Clostridioides difficile TaxID=1496 RepID=UPI001E64DAF8|nr:phage head-tail connector protein [Clostridioides difficile]MBZ0626458.1 phage head-tail connector protein [Clostridioides difficile]MCE0773256.1 phage head-tail connector protein [Clostridioides difficile]MCE0784371.1 phage head-tail connector protein [Clostridioides difficile]MCE0815446.1 phage head-tail connector protein [Clostridioides difficile]MCE0835007.1 phage head-tail connector protein [Clostridioides difficile]